ncbi:UNVERIFIED_CONTAM: hypothetical protein ABIC26_000442 [Paenibacillus sp. PvR008]
MTIQKAARNKNIQSNTLFSADILNFMLLNEYKTRAAGEIRKTFMCTKNKDDHADQSWPSRILSTPSSRSFRTLNHFATLLESAAFTA